MTIYSIYPIFLYKSGKIVGMEKPESPLGVYLSVVRDTGIFVK